jgi:hypothetical protein
MLGLIDVASASLLVGVIGVLVMIWQLCVAIQNGKRR